MNLDNIDLQKEFDLTDSEMLNISNILQSKNVNMIEKDKINLINKITSKLKNSNLQLNENETPEEKKQRLRKKLKEHNNELKKNRMPKHVLLSKTEKKINEKKEIIEESTNTENDEKLEDFMV